jgi:hypothetical protein
VTEVESLAIATEVLGGRVGRRANLYVTFNPGMLEYDVFALTVRDGFDGETLACIRVYDDTSADELRTELAAVPSQPR